MNPERWQQFKQIVQAALDLPQPERAAYVLEACGDDEELRRDVIALLDSEAQAGAFMDNPAADYIPTEEITDSFIGRRIGAYRIVSEIGTGGMGHVYLAERADEFKQKVALKLLKREMAYRQLISRFRNERQILAGLDHPCIARLLDGGATEDGHPYFVMEYVEGVTIDHYCANRALSIPERLKLFRHVCSAVQYAHQNLIVHRDLKPGNILVTADGTPKLLDFGIAKLLRPDPAQPTVALTQVGVRMMTPEYASPEQVRGLAITTSTDVYSLGIVLYELLSGHPPYEFKTRSPTEIERVICEQEPPRPSTLAVAPLSHQLAGDLDTIVLKAIEKDPQHRYRSVEQLSEDIRRHLERMPITARPQTLKYRMSKFVRRNRTAVAAAAMVLLSLTGGLIASAWEAHVARLERARAEQRFQDVRNLAESLLSDVYDKITKGDATEARQSVVAKALEYLSILEHEAAGDPSLQLDLADGYLRLGDVQGNPFLSGKSDPTGALDRYDKALRLAVAVALKDPRNARALRIQGRAQRLRGDVLTLLGKNPDAISSANKSVEMFKSLSAAYPADAGYLRDLSQSFEALGDKFNPGLSGLADAKAAAEAYRSALDIWRKILAKDAKQPGGPRAVAVLTMKLADMQWYTGPEQPVRELYQKALESIRGADLKIAENLSVDTSIRRKLVSLDAEKHPAEAASQYHEFIAFREKLLAQDSKNSRLRTDLVVLLLDYGQVQERIPGALTGAIECYRRAWDLLTPLREGDRNNVMMQDMGADAALRLGRTLAQAGQREQAAKAVAQAFDIYKYLMEQPGSAPWLNAEYADVLLHVDPPEKRNPALALKYAQVASDAEQGKNPKYLDLLAEAYFRTGQRKQAVETEQRALDLMPPDSADRQEFEKRLKQFSR